jgi:uncharacterized protein (TIGR02246 family)
MPAFLGEDAMLRTFALMASLGLLAACDPQASIGPRIGEAVREQESALAAAVQAEDAAAAAAFYAPDAASYVPFEAPQTTPEAILAGFQELFADPNGSLTFSTSDVILPSSSDYAITEGDFTVTYTDPATNQQASIGGRYMTLWRRQDDDSWKIMRDFSTPGAPPEAPAAPEAPPATPTP